MFVLLYCVSCNHFQVAPLCKFQNEKSVLRLSPLVLISFKSLFVQHLQAKTVLMISGLTFLGVVFFFTMAQAWVTDFTTVNRATLHIVPALMFYTMLLAQRFFHDTAFGQEVSV